MPRKTALLLPSLLALTLATPAWANDDLEVTMEVMDSFAELQGNELVLDLVEDNAEERRERDGFFAGLFGADERESDRARERELAEIQLEERESDFDDELRDDAEEIEADDIREERQRDFAEHDHMDEGDMHERDGEIDELDTVDELTDIDEVNEVGEVDEMDDAVDLSDLEGDINEELEISDLNEEPANDASV